MKFDGNFREAAKDYLMLLDKGYPVSASLKLVGDRYRLDKPGRIVLFRGILPSSLSAGNASRRLETLKPRSGIAVDGYNVLFTLLNYMRGHPVFISTDRLLRDAGGAHGRIADQGQFRNMSERLARNLVEIQVAEVSIFLDSPVPGSGLHAQDLREDLAAAGVRGIVEVVPSADYYVQSWRGDAIATSDSAIVARSPIPVFDLAKWILMREFDAEFADLSALISE